MELIRTYRSLGQVACECNFICPDLKMFKYQQSFDLPRLTDLHQCSLSAGIPGTNTSSSKLVKRHKSCTRELL